MRVIGGAGHTPRCRASASPRTSGQHTLVCLLKALHLHKSLTRFIGLRKTPAGGRGGISGPPSDDPGPGLLRDGNRCRQCCEHVISTSLL